jgi:hypothetical protein
MFDIEHQSYLRREMLTRLKSTACIQKALCTSAGLSNLRFIVLVYSSSTSIDACTRLARPADPGSNLRGDLGALRMFNGLGWRPTARHGGGGTVCSVAEAISNNEQPTCSVSQGASFPGDVALCRAQQQAAVSDLRCFCPHAMSSFSGAVLAGGGGAA